MTKILEHRRGIVQARPWNASVNHALVKDGWCWTYRKYVPGDTVLEALEKEAREAKKGLWVDPHLVPPWEWRKRNSPLP